MIFKKFDRVKTPSTAAKAWMERLAVQAHFLCSLTAFITVHPTPITAPEFQSGAVEEVVMQTMQAFSGVMSKGAMTAAPRMVAMAASSSAMPMKEESDEDMGFGDFVDDEDVRYGMAAPTGTLQEQHEQIRRVMNRSADVTDMRASAKNLSSKASSSISNMFTGLHHAIMPTRKGPANVTKLASSASAPAPSPAKLMTAEVIMRLLALQDIDGHWTSLPSWPRCFPP